MTDEQAGRSPLDPLEMVPLPVAGRRFATSRRVRWGDTDATGRLRLDATARFLQDVANDDTRDAGHDPFAPWVVRRTAVEVTGWPELGEIVTLTTFSAGHGSRWAERRTIIEGDAGSRVDAAALWVFVDPETGVPKRLTDEFHATYDEAAGGRKVAARLRLPGPSSDGPGDGGTGDGMTARPWPLRRTDLDSLGHVNNAATWSPFQDELDRRGLVATYAEVEYGDAVAPDDQVTLLVEERPAGGSEGSGSTILAAWLTVGGAVRASAHLAADPA